MPVFWYMGRLILALVKQRERKRVLAGRKWMSSNPSVLSLRQDTVQLMEIGRNIPRGHIFSMSSAAQ